MNPHLFVYGTLLSTATGSLGRSQRARLQREAMRVGEASINARMIDFGTYPGLIAATSQLDTTWGEVYRLADPKAAFSWLDSYERIDASRKDNDYERIELDVRLPARAEDMKAWVYFTRLDVSAFPVLKSGRWDRR